MVRRFVAVITFTAAVLLTPVAASGNATPRPIKGSINQTTVAIGTNVTSSGTAIVSHLGRGTAQADFTFSIDADQLVLVGTSALTAANGDRLESRFTGTADFLPGTGATGSFTLFVTITGGTGRFGDAAGSYVARGTNTVLSFGAQVVIRSVSTLEGHVTY